MKVLRIILGAILLLPGMCAGLFMLASMPQIIGSLLVPKWAGDISAFYPLMPLWLVGLLIGWAGWWLLSRK